MAGVAILSTVLAVIGRGFECARVRRVVDHGRSASGGPRAGLYMRLVLFPGNADMTGSTRFWVSQGRSQCFGSPRCVDDRPCAATAGVTGSRDGHGRGLLAAAETTRNAEPHV